MTGKAAREPAAGRGDGRPVFGPAGFQEQRRARLRRFEPEWRAFLVTRDAGSCPRRAYWTRAQIEGGWLCEMAGSRHDRCRCAACPLATGCEVSDLMRGMRRIVVPRGGRCARRRRCTSPGRQAARRETGSSASSAPEASAAELLAGRPQHPPPDRGPAGLRLPRRRRSAKSWRRWTTVPTAVKRVPATQAGTNCGSCRPVIAGLLAA